MKNILKYSFNKDVIGKCARWMCGEAGIVDAGFCVQSEVPNCVCGDGYIDKLRNETCDPAVAGMEKCCNNVTCMGCGAGNETYVFFNFIDS